MLVMVIIAPFGMLYVPSTLIVPRDAATTASHIVASESLFRLSIASNSIVFLIEIVLCALLYSLLKPVSKTLSLVSAFARLAMTVMQGINMLNHFVALLLLSGNIYLAVFKPDQLHALAMLFLNAHQEMVMVWGLSFGLHLMVLGYLVYKSDYLPRFVGILLIIAAACYFTQGFGNILLPNYKDIFTSIGALSIIEIAFPLWLLIKGVNLSKMKLAAGIEQTEETHMIGF